MVPAEYNTVIFADIRAILQDAGLRQALDDLGLLAALGPAGDAIQSQADVLVLARRGSRALGILSPNPPKDTDGRREDSGRGWVRELQGRWPGGLG